jgi:hypothetical protein
MGMYGFKKQFCPKVESGEKTHTIRGKRKYPDKPGNTLHLYYAPRTKQCRLLLRAPCTKVLDIVLADSGRRFHDVIPVQNGRRLCGIYPLIEIDGTRLADDEMEALAIRDGFESLWEMSGFWDLNQPFNGDIIHWKYPGEKS